MVKLHKRNPHISPLCWRECGEVGTHAHIWWQCHLIQSYWVEVLDLIKKISGNEIGLDPWQCLFHAMGVSRKKYRAAITPFLLNAAKALIPKQWKSKKVQTIKNWLREVDKTRLMEEVIHSQNDSETRFVSIWKGWLEFKQSLVYVSYMGSDGSI